MAKYKKINDFDGFRTVHKMSGSVAGGNTVVDLFNKLFQ